MEGPFKRTHYDGDSLLIIRFTPEAIRNHFSGSAMQEKELASLSDESLAEAARRIVPELQAANEVFMAYEEILDEASAVEAARRN